MNLLDLNRLEAIIQILILDLTVINTTLFIIMIKVHIFERENHVSIHCHSLA